MRLRRLLSALAPTLFALLFAGAGFLACYLLIRATFQREITTEAMAYTLGALLETKPDQRQGIAGVYHDGARALSEIDRIAWAVPTIPTPFVGTAPAPGQHGNARINAMQFRADREVPMPKPPGTFRVFITGGSTAFGNGAPSDATTIGGYLNAILARELAPRTGLNYEVFTLANPGWASTQERIVIENRLSEMQPDLVIALSGNNDVHWGSLGRDSLWFRSYADTFFLSLIKGVYRLTGQPAIPENTPIQADPVAPSRVAERLLKNARISAFVLAAADSDYVFVLQPTLAVSNKSLSPRERERVVHRDYFRQSYALIAEGLARLPGERYQFVDLSGIFDDRGAAEEVFLDSFHFGDKGNEIIAAGIFQRIRDRLERP